MATDSAPAPRRRTTRVTSFDIAYEVGVSQPTVSRALRGDKNISEATRMRIMEVAKALNYTVDRNAVRLRSNSTGTLALVVLCEFGEDRSSINPFYYGLLGSIEAAAAAKGFSLLVSFQDSSQNLFGQYEDSRQADGIIVVGSARNREAWDYFKSYGTEDKAIICWGAPDEGLLTVGSDNMAGGALATQHLIATGRRDIAFVGPLSSGHRQFAERHRGYLSAVDAVGLSPVPVAEGGTARRDQYGYQAVCDLLDAATPFDAIFAACDLIALGALKALHDRGKTVPADVAVVGFDGIGAAAYASPSLSTIEQDMVSAGNVLIDNLLARIKGAPTSGTLLPVKLCVRESSGTTISF